MPELILFRTLFGLSLRRLATSPIVRSSSVVKSLVAFGRSSCSGKFPDSFNCINVHLIAPWGFPSMKVCRQDRREGGALFIASYGDDNGHSPFIPGDFLRPDHREVKALPATICFDVRCYRHTFCFWLAWRGPRPRAPRPLFANLAKGVLRVLPWICRDFTSRRALGVWGIGEKRGH